MKLPYVSIDIETTGLDPDKHQILEFAAVYDDWSKPIDQLPVFRRLIQWDTIVGSPFALQMNADLLKEMVRYPKEGLAIDKLAGQFRAWLCERGEWDNVTAAGKNFDSFDLRFLERVGFDFFKHRSIDPAVLFWMPEDTVLPNLSTCLERAGLDNFVSHRALDDARNVVRLIRHCWKGNFDA